MGRKLQGLLQIAHHRLVRGLFITGLKGLNKVGMFVGQVRCAVSATDHTKVGADLNPKRVCHTEQNRRLCVRIDAEVEPVIPLKIGLDVPCLDRPINRGIHADQVFDIPIGQVLHRAARQLWFDLQPQEIDVRQVFFAEFRHRNPAVVHRVNCAFRRQTANGFAHGRHADTQTFGQPHDRDLLARRKLPKQYLVAYPFVHGLMLRYFAVLVHASCIGADPLTLLFLAKSLAIVKLLIKFSGNIWESSMKKTTSLLVVASLMAGAATADEVRVYNWSDYIDEALLEKFEEETGIELIYDVFDSNEVLETKMLAGSSGYDVVVPTGDFLQRQIAAGAFQELDFSKLPNSENLWDLIKDRTAQYDPGNAYSVNYMWGTTGIGVNVAKVTEALGEDAPIDSLDLLLNPENMEKLASCGVYMLDAPTEVIPAALAYLGEDPNTFDEDLINKAGDTLLSVRPYIQKFHSSEYINALANGDICVAFGWSGDVLQARDRADEADNGVEIAYNAPKEGALMWFDQMAIPADAPNPEAAHTFLNFIMDAQNMADASNYVYYANGNIASQPLLEEDVIGDPAIYPSEETLGNLYTAVPYPPKTQRIVTRLWTKVKSGT